MTVTMRAAGDADRAELAGLYTAAFPDEDLVALVETLTGDASRLLGLVATDAQDRVIGHVHFTRCAVAGRPEALALLAPLAVLPDCQGQGIGTALVRASLGGLAALLDVAHLLVLGDPGYYERFGFTTETGILPPYPLSESWRSAAHGRA